MLICHYNVHIIRAVFGDNMETRSNILGVVNLEGNEIYIVHTPQLDIKSTDTQIEGGKVSNAYDGDFGDDAQ